MASVSTHLTMCLHQEIDTVTTTNLSLEVMEGSASCATTAVEMVVDRVEQAPAKTCIAQWWWAGCFITGVNSDVSSLRALDPRPPIGLACTGCRLGGRSVLSQPSTAEIAT